MCNQEADVSHPHPDWTTPLLPPQMSKFLSTAKIANLRVRSLREQDYSISLTIAQEQSKKAQLVQLVATSYLRKQTQISQKFMSTMMVSRPIIRKNVYRQWEGNFNLTYKRSYVSRTNKMPNLTWLSIDSRLFEPSSIFFPLLNSPRPWNNSPKPWNNPHPCW